MAGLTISESGSALFLTSQSGAPALLVTGASNQLTLYSGTLAATDAGPAVQFTGGDNSLANVFGTIRATGVTAILGSAFDDTIFNLATIVGEVRLEGGNDVFQTVYRGTTGAVRGGAGDDNLSAVDASSAVTFYGDDGNDSLTGGGAADQLFGGNNDDGVAGGGGDDALDGGSGNDVIDGGSGNDRLDGGAGDDRLTGGFGNDALLGGGGADVAVYAGYLRGFTTSGAAGSRTITDVDGSDGNEGSDTLTGIDVVRFADQQVDLRIVRSEIAYGTANATITNSVDRYGYFAVDVQGAGSTLINTATIRGTAIAHYGQFGPAAEAALAINADNVTVENRTGAAILGVGNALSAADVQRQAGGVDYYRPGNNLRVTNDGLIQSLEGTAIRDPNYFTVFNNAGGRIVGVTGIAAPNAYVDIANAGLIHGTDRAIDDVRNLVNTGRVEGDIGGRFFSSLTNSGTIVGGYYGYGGGTLVNTGQIVTGVVDDELRIGRFQIDAGEAAQRYPGGGALASFDNRGVFTGNVEVIGQTAFATPPGGPVAFVTTIANSGTITGVIGSYATVAASSNGSVPAASFVERVTNTGLIDGQLVLGGGDDSVITTGAITGSVDLGAGDDRVRLDTAAATTGRLIGGGGIDTIEFGDSAALTYDAATGRADHGVVYQTTGFEHVVGTGFADQLRGGKFADLFDGAGGNDVLIGSFGADRLNGGAGDDRIDPGPGQDVVDGGGGTDTLVLGGRLSDFFAVRAGGDSWTVIGVEGTRTVSNFETVELAAGAVSWTDFTARAFDGLRYLASNSDLAAAYGNNVDAARNHYLTTGIGEGRNLTNFNPLEYGASYPDLAATFGTDTQALSNHYIVAGKAEGRAVTFDPYAYGAQNADIANAYGNDPFAMTQHYVVQGYREGRTTAFDTALYAASNLDLVQRFGLDSHALAEHYVTVGRGEGRATASFDALLYGASNSDLAAAFGANATALARHYIIAGQYEGRPLEDFDALDYAAVNRDLAAAYGTNEQGLLGHYLVTGRVEGRAVGGFDEVAYLLSNGDLRAAGLGADGALRHWLIAGAAEGRDGDARFGREQSDHALSFDTSRRDTLATSADRDWFAIDLLSGGSADFALAATTGSGFRAPRLEISDAAGHSLATAFDTDADVVLRFTAPLDGLYYVSVAASQAGNYQLSALIG